MDGRVTLRWVFVLDGRCNVVCVRGSVRRAEKRCGGSNLAAIQVCCCGFAKVIGWRMTKGGRLCRTSMKGWLVKPLLCAVLPTAQSKSWAEERGFALGVYFAVTVTFGMCESRCPGSTNLPDLQGGQQTKDGIWQTTDNCLQQKCKWMWRRTRSKYFICIKLM